MEQLPEFHKPADALAYFLGRKGTTAYQLSKETLLAQSRISEILAGRRRVSTETATVLGAYFGTGAEYWMAVQTKQDLESARVDESLHSEFHGELPIGGFVLRCYVLPDERRLISARHFYMLFGINSTQVGPARLASLIDSPYLKSDKMEALRRVLAKPLRIVDEKGISVLCYEGTVVVDFCRAMLDVRRVDGLPKWAERFADAAEIIISSVAKVGIIALIDEATGYQARRHREALQRLLDAYFREEYAAWSKKFPDWFYEEMFRLKGWKWENISSTKRPPYVGKLTKDIVYARLEQGVIEQLEHLNPKDEDGRRKQKHHQWLTEQVGHPALDAHFYALRGIMRMHTKWDRFYHSLQLAHPKRNEAVQLELADFEEGDEK
jgi:addiction module HigA family antidote